MDSSWVPLPDVIHCLIVNVGVRIRWLAGAVGSQFIRDTESIYFRVMDLSIIFLMTLRFSFRTDTFLEPYPGDMVTVSSIRSFLSNERCSGLMYGPRPTKPIPFLCII